MFIWIFVHLRNPINVRQIELLTIWLYSEWGEDRFVVVQHLWCRKICQIVCRVSRKWMESKFLDQDVDVVSLANKGIVIGCFVGRNYNKILMETGKLTDNIRVTKNGLGSGVDGMFQSSDSAFYHFTDRLNPFGKSVELDTLFLGPLPGICFTYFLKGLDALRTDIWLLGLKIKGGKLLFNFRILYRLYRKNGEFMPKELFPFVFSGPKSIKFELSILLPFRKYMVFSTLPDIKSCLFVHRIP